MSSSPRQPYLLKLRVVPNASKSEIGGWMEDGYLKVRIQSPAQEGKANKALIAFLSKTTGVSKKRISIESGETSRQKVIAFHDLSDSEFERLPRK